MKLTTYQKAAVVVVVIVIGLIVAHLSIGNATNTLNLTSQDNTPVPAYMINRLMVPNNVSSAVGIGLGKPLQQVNGTNLTYNGKPEILYMGAEYCPFCAAERWPLTIALMRFGTFSGLEYMTSSATDYSPNTPTFTFLHATYTSKYISFVSVEMLGNKPVNGSYPTLQTPNASENALMSKYDGPTASCSTGGCIPFIDFANKAVDVGATYDPLSVLDSYSWNTTSENLYNTSSLQSSSIIGQANIFTAEICNIDNNTPQSVCGQQYIKRIESSAG